MRWEFGGRLWWGGGRVCTVHGLDVIKCGVVPARCTDQSLCLIFSMDLLYLICRESTFVMYVICNVIG